MMAEKYKVTSGLIVFLVTVMGLESVSASLGPVGLWFPRRVNLWFLASLAPLGLISHFTHCGWVVETLPSRLSSPSRSHSALSSSFASNASVRDIWSIVSACSTFSHFFLGVGPQNTNDPVQDADKGSHSGDQWLHQHRKRGEPVFGCLNVSMFAFLLQIPKWN